MAARAKRRLSRAQVARRQRADGRRDPAYLMWVRGQQCLGCGRYGCDPHHEPPRSHADWHDHKTVPLCRQCHDRRHAMGAVRFWLAIEAMPSTVIGALRASYSQSFASEPPF